MPNRTEALSTGEVVRWTCCCGSSSASLPPGTALRASCRLCGARADLVAPRHLDHRRAGPCHPTD